mgnify:CR=1 FL=1
MESKVMTEEGEPLRGFIGIGDTGRLIEGNLLAARDLIIAYSRPSG